MLEQTVPVSSITVRQAGQGTGTSKRALPRHHTPTFLRITHTPTHFSLTRSYLLCPRQLPQQLSPRPPLLPAFTNSFRLASHCRYGWQHLRGRSREQGQVPVLPLGRFLYAQNRDRHRLLEQTVPVPCDAQGQRARQTEQGRATDCLSKRWIVPCISTFCRVRPALQRGGPQAVETASNSRSRAPDDGRRSPSADPHRAHRKYRA